MARIREISHEIFQVRFGLRRCFKTGERRRDRRIKSECKSAQIAANVTPIWVDDRGDLRRRFFTGYCRRERRRMIRLFGLEPRPFWTSLLSARLYNENVQF